MRTDHDDAPATSAALDGSDAERARRAPASGGSEGDSDGDSEDDSEIHAVLRAVAHAPPRQPPSVALPGSSRVSRSAPLAEVDVYGFPNFGAFVQWLYSALGVGNPPKTAGDGMNAPPTVT